MCVEENKFPLWCRCVLSVKYRKDNCIETKRNEEEEAAAVAVEERKRLKKKKRKIARRAHKIYVSSIYLICELEIQFHRKNNTRATDWRKKQKLIWSSEENDKRRRRWNPQKSLKLRRQCKITNRTATVWTVQHFYRISKHSIKCWNCRWSKPHGIRVKTFMDVWKVSKNSFFPSFFYYFPFKKMQNWNCAGCIVAVMVQQFGTCAFCPIEPLA